MSRGYVAAMSLALVSALAIPGAGRAQGHEDADEKTIRSLENQEREAVLKVDVPALKRLWSEHFVVNNPQNLVSPNRDAVLQRVTQGLIHYTLFERRIECIRFDGERVERRFTHVWKQDGATWRLIARHANVILNVDSGAPRSTIR